MPNKKPLAFHGIQNAKVCVRAADGAPGTTLLTLPLVKSIAVNPAFSKQDVYAGNTLALSVPNDQGYDSTLGVTGQDLDFETAIGHLMLLNGGYGNIETKDLKRFDLYYEYIMHPEGGVSYVVKVWQLNLAVVAKPTWQHDTDTESLSIAPYQYGIKHYGDIIKDAVGTADYVDTNGFRYKAFTIRAVPTDTGYAAFDATVPTAKIPTAG
jgi:hypothetical protein